MFRDGVFYIPGRAQQPLAGSESAHVIVNLELVEGLVAIHQGVETDLRQQFAKQRFRCQVDVREKRFILVSVPQQVFLDQEVWRFQAFGQQQRAKQDIERDLVTIVEILAPDRLQFFSFPPDPAS